VTDQNWQSELRARLEQAGLQVESRASDEWQVSRGGDPFKATARLDPEALTDSIIDAPSDDRPAFTAAVVRGVLEVLYEPDDSDGDQWTFDRAAGSILPTLERPGFLAGASDAADGEVWSDEFEDDLSITYRLLLDDGKRVLTADQVDDWGVSPDRVSSAARSLLFHRSRDTSPRHVDDTESVETLDIDDGHDAARLIVLEDLMFGEFDDSSRIAVPTPDTLLFIRRGDEASIDELKRVVRQRFEASGEPLTRRLFQFRTSQPQAV